MTESEYSLRLPTQSFQSTHWSLVVAANLDDSPQAQDAMERLCRIYWYPLYAFIRRRGHDTERAKDLTQEFFSRLLAKQYLRAADRDRGRLRTFLLSCVEHFLSNERKKDNAIKRGGEYTFVPLEDATIEERYQAEPEDNMSPDKLLDRRWALTLLEMSFEQLRHEYGKAGKAPEFDVLQADLSGANGPPRSFAQIGAQLGVTESAARQAAFRLRSRFGQLLRQLIAQTVASPKELEVELNHLREILSTRAGGY